jgi:carbonic anhydrase
MAYAIMRWNKLKTVEQAKAATAHNYRQYPVLNADEQAPYPSIELLNTAEQGYWELATERIAEAGITRLRRDAVRCAEVILTASPEWFARDATGVAADYSTSEWLQDNLHYLKQTFGEKNVVAFKLHQDEKTPHIHAVITPITPDGRLSGRDLLGPASLRQYQTSYAVAMAEHGLRRGVEYSQAEHQPMRRFYGQQAQTARQVGELTGPAAYQPLVVARPGRVQADPQGWADKESRRLNEEARRQVEAANKRAEIAHSVALENANAKEQVRVLQKQLSTSEAHKQGKSTEVDKLTGELARVRGELAIATGQVEQARLERERFAVARLERRPVPALVAEDKQWQDKREAERQYVVRPLVEDVLKKGQFETKEGYFQQLEGYTYQEGRNGQPGYLLQVAHPNMSFSLAEVRQEGAAPLLQAVQEVIDARTQSRQQFQLRSEQQARAQAERAQQASVVRELALMQRAFKIYGWKIAPGELTACLLVPDTQVRRVEELLRTPGCHGSVLGVQGEPGRQDGKTAVYARYQLQKAPAVTTILAQVKEWGGDVIETASDQTRRLRSVAQPLSDRGPSRHRPRSSGYEIE